MEAGEQVVGQIVDKEDNLFYYGYLRTYLPIRTNTQSPN